MPEMLKEPVPSRMTWTGATLAQSDDWITRLTPDECEEIDAALRGVQRAGLAWGHFGAAGFPLPALGPRLARCEEEIKNGRGFALLRGLDVGRYSLDELKTIYWGLSVHLGTVVSQNALGTLIEEIADKAPKNLGDSNLRSYVTAQAQPPHADLADVVGLLCVDRAKEGGTSVIVSMMEIYNRMLRDKPEYLQALYEGYYHDLRGEGPTGDPDEVSDAPVPVFSYRDGRLRSWFHGKKIRQGAAKRGIALTPLQREALDYVERLGTDPEVRMDMQLERGDIQLLNNYMALHYRTAFVDGDGHKRLMLRIWIELRDMGDFDPALDRWVRQGVPRQDWVKDGILPAVGRV
ncbi:TauD/TfdA family dioxygenase [Bordetella genomosp. 10]|nr:TauD/TfdA family dioxygenase [Bordetella genomosp. 10]